MPIWIWIIQYVYLNIRYDRCKEITPAIVLAEYTSEDKLVMVRSLWYTTESTRPWICDRIQRYGSDPPGHFTIADCRFRAIHNRTSLFPATVVIINIKKRSYLSSASTIAAIIVFTAHPRIDNTGWKPLTSNTSMHRRCWKFGPGDEPVDNTAIVPTLDGHLGKYISDRSLVKLW